MSVEERLYALAQQSRQQSGDGFLLAASQLTPRLNSQAPDLHAEIRALAAAFANGAAARINAAPNPDAEAAAIASEIAVQEKLSMASVTPAVNVARRIGPLVTGYSGTPSPAGWAGDSMAVGASPAPAAPQAPPQAPPQHYAPAYQPPPQAQQGYAPQYTPAPGAPPAPGQEQSQADKLKALSKNPLVMGACALVAAFVLYQNFNKPSEEINTIPIQRDGQGGMQGQGGQGQGGMQGQGGQGQGGMQGQGGQGGMQGQGGQGQGQGGANQAPLLTPNIQGAPTLQVQRFENGAPAIGFQLQTQRGPAPGIIVLPQGGWQSGPVGFGLANPGDFQGQNLATAGQGQFQLQQSNGHPVRLAQIQLQQDQLGVGNVCLAFRGQQGQQDVQLSGADFCVMDGPCSQPIGCGKLQ